MCVQIHKIKFYHYIMCINNIFCFKNMQYSVLKYLVMDHSEFKLEGGGWGVEEK